MSGAEDWDEFELIGRLFRPLAKGAPEALDLLDDAAVIPSRPGFDLVVTKDALVEGVHFLPADPMDLVARKALRVNLSDLAAMRAEPYGYFLAVAWPPKTKDREAFARGLAEDQGRFGLKLFGGDTVSTPGPLTISITMLGWVTAGAAMLRSTARAGDPLVVSGVIGDGYLGLSAALGGTGFRSPEDRAYLADRYRLPSPRFDLAGAMSGLRAAADVSDGLVADAGKIAEASGLAVEIDLDLAPLSAAALSWLQEQGDRASALLALTTGGDDYEIVGAAKASLPEAPWTVVGRFGEGRGVTVRIGGRAVAVPRPGYRHGKDG